MEKAKKNARTLLIKGGWLEKKPKMIIKMMDLETDVRFISLCIEADFTQTFSFTGRFQRGCEGQ